jgi:hypothetical protein
MQCETTRDRSNPCEPTLEPFGAAALMQSKAIATEGRTPISKSSSNREPVTIAFDTEHKVSIQLGISAGVLETN